jgi:hypothetical protein
MPKKARSWSPNDHLVHHHVRDEHAAAERRETVMHGVNRAVGCIRGHICKERRTGDAESDFLAFQIAALLELPAD